MGHMEIFKNNFFPALAVFVVGRICHSPSVVGLGDKLDFTDN